MIIGLYAVNPTINTYTYDYNAISKEDVVSNRLLTRFDADMLQRFSPRSIRVDGNSFFRSASLGLYGTDDYYVYLRVVTALHMIENQSLYDVSSDSFALHDTCVSTPCFSSILRSALSDGTTAELVHVFALSGALGTTIQSYCVPGTHGIDGNHPYTVSIRGHVYDVVLSSDEITIMWTVNRQSRETNLPPEPNHFILLVPRAWSTGIEIYQPEIDCITSQPHASNQQPEVASPSNVIGTSPTAVHRRKRRRQQQPTTSTNQRAAGQVPHASNQQPEVASPTNTSGQLPEVGLLPVAESTRHDESQRTQSPNQSFNVTSPFVIPNAQLENTVIELADNDTSLPRNEPTLTFRLVDGGTKRGQAKLVDSLGYSYTVKRRNPKVTYWECSRRRGIDHCTASVIERIGHFRRGDNSHTHPPVIGAETNIVIQAQARQMAVDHVFESAGAIVQRTITANVNMQAPNPALPTITSLVRLVNRRREDMRPNEPTTMDFVLASEHIPQGFLRADILTHGRRHLLFATDEQLSLLARCKTWYVDATFYVVKAPFIQLFSIHAFLRQDDVTKQVPLAFALMAGKKKKVPTATLR